MTFNDGVTLRAKRTILVAMASASPDRGTLLGESLSEPVRLSLEQSLEWACGPVTEELLIHRGRNVEDVIFGPLQRDLARKTFVAGGSAPSLADWSLFALLFNRIVQTGRAPSISSNTLPPSESMM